MKHKAFLYIILNVQSRKTITNLYPRFLLLHFFQTHHYMTLRYPTYFIRGSIVASISACHAEDPGSIPGLGDFCL